MSNYCAILESYIIEPEDIAVESIGDKLKSVGKSIKERVRKLIEFLQSIWRRFADFMRRFKSKTKDRTSARHPDSSDHETDNVDTSEIKHAESSVENVGREIGAEISAFSKSNDTILDACVTIATKMLDTYNRLNKYIASAHDDSIRSLMTAKEIRSKYLANIDAVLKELKGYKNDINTRLEKISTVDVDYFKTKIERVMKYKKILKNDFSFNLLIGYNSGVYNTINENNKNKLLEILNKVRDSGPDDVVLPWDLGVDGGATLISTLQLIINKYNQYLTSVMQVSNLINNA